jgi:hypothetical protein
MEYEEFFQEVMKVPIDFKVILAIVAPFCETQAGTA